jgi:anti-sigma28 factor (negative regulator of flagellin synthesis)
MKIEDRVSSYMALMQVDTPKDKHKPDEAAGAPLTADKSPAEVDLSAAAVQLADDEVRRERLNIIRQQLAEGSYNISGKDVANKILTVLKG